MIDPLSLLEATDHRGQNTTPEIAAILDVTEDEAEQALRQAERDGLVHEETDESRNVAPDVNRQVWFLTDAGRDERDRLSIIP
jgi:DNA-binding MarR family transcriptional regulator